MRLLVVGDVHIGNQVSTRIDDYFETCKRKLRFVFENCDIAVFLGDIFNTPVIDTGKLFEICGLFMEYPNVRKYTILGNHDLYNMNESTLYKTSLGLLELMGLITLIPPYQSILVDDKLSLSAMPLNFSEVINCPTPNLATIVLGHHFFGLNCSDSLRQEDLDRLYPCAKFIFLGHDHQYYEPVGRVYRPGSLLRNAATDYNRNRKPIVYAIDTDTLDLIGEIEIPAEDGKAVFLDNAVVKKREKFMESLDKVLNLKPIQSETSKASMLSILSELETPKNIMDYISQTCKVAGVPLK